MDLKRYEIINCLHAEDEKREDQESMEDQPIKGFWLRVMKNGDECKRRISEKDEEILSKIIDIRYEKLEENV